MITQADIDKVAAAAAAIPPARGSYLEEDFVTNLMATVLDYQQTTATVERAIAHYKDQRWDQLRTIDDLEDLFATFPADKDGNTALAQELWGYRLWTRAQQLREI